MPVEESHNVGHNGSAMTYTTTTTLDVNMQFSTKNSTGNWIYTRNIFYTQTLIYLKPKASTGVKNLKFLWEKWGRWGCGSRNGPLITIVVKSSIVDLKALHVKMRVMMHIPLSCYEMKRWYIFNRSIWCKEMLKRLLHLQIHQINKALKWTIYQKAWTKQKT